MGVRFRRRCAWTGGLVGAITTALFGAAEPASAATPVAVWHMDETSGTTMVDAAGDNNGVLRSVTLGVPGKSGTGYGFGGKSSYVSVPNNASLNPGTGDVTIMLSFMTTSRPGGSADWDLARKGYFKTVGGEWKVEFQPEGQASCGFKGSSSYQFLQAGPKTLADGKWHTVTCTKTASTIKLTVDGQTFSKSGKVGSISNTQPVVIGAYPGKEFFKGTLDEVTVTQGS
jgi:Concanavalin A-like lectin/glucanases superfamily